MKESKNELTSYEPITESDVFQMFNDTSNLIAEHNTNQLSSAAVSAQNSSVLTNNVELDGQELKTILFQHCNSGLY